MQKEQVIEVKIPIPAGWVLIREEENEKLLQERLLGRQWKMKDVEKVIGKDARWIRDKILYPYRDELDVSKGGFISYPKTTGQPWSFGALKMAHWLEENQHVIFGR